MRRKSSRALHTENKQKGKFLLNYYFFYQHTQQQGDDVNNRCMLTMFVQSFFGPLSKKEEGCIQTYIYACIIIVRLKRENVITT